MLRLRVPVLWVLTIMQALIWHASSSNRCVIWRCERQKTLRHWHGDLMISARALVLKYVCSLSSSLFWTNGTWLRNGSASSHTATGAAARNSRYLQSTRRRLSRTATRRN